MLLRKFWINFWNFLYFGLSPFSRMRIFRKISFVKIYKWNHRLKNLFLFCFFKLKWIISVNYSIKFYIFFITVNRSRTIKGIGKTFNFKTLMFVLFFYTLCCRLYFLSLIILISVFHTYFSLNFFPFIFQIINFSF